MATSVCDICHKYKYSETCPCGKKVCKLCVSFHVLLAISEENHYYIETCKDEAVMRGSRGKIVYSKDDAQFVTDDPDYQPMLNELSQLKQEIVKLKQESDRLEQENEQLKIEIDCRPGGTEYNKAKERFESKSY